MSHGKHRSKSKGSHKKRGAHPHDHYGVNPNYNPEGEYEYNYPPGGMQMEKDAPPDYEEAEGLSRPADGFGGGRHSGEREGFGGGGGGGGGRPRTLQDVAEKLADANQWSLIATESKFASGTALAKGHSSYLNLDVPGGDKSLWGRQVACTWLWDLCLSPCISAYGYQFVSSHLDRPSAALMRRTCFPIPCWACCPRYPFQPLPLGADLVDYNTNGRVGYIQRSDPFVNPLCQANYSAFDDQGQPLFQIESGYCQPVSCFCFSWGACCCPCSDGVERLTLHTIDGRKHAYEIQHPVSTCDCFSAYRYVNYGSIRIPADAAGDDLTAAMLVASTAYLSENHGTYWASTCFNDFPLDCNGSGDCGGGGCDCNC